MGILATAYYGQHQIVIEFGYLSWSGIVTVKYDGRKMLEQRGTTQHFQVSEDGMNVQYDINLSGWDLKTVEISRNGIVFFSTKPGFVPPPIPVSDPTPSVSQNSQPIQKEVIVREIVLVVCPNCGHRNDSSRRTCENCHASI